MCDNCQLYVLRAKRDQIKTLIDTLWDDIRMLVNELLKVKAQIRAEEGSRRLRLVK